MKEGCRDGFKVFTEKNVGLGEQVPETIPDIFQKTSTWQII